MKLYSDYLEVNKNFQTSINLELDLNNESKIDEYIPTTDICDVLKRYAKTIMGKTKDKATLLVGPYGKGKSFLLLVLSYLFGKNKDSQCWVNLVNKIGKIDHELYELLIEAKKKNVSLLTVVVNSYYDNVVQAFQVGLHETLQREGISDIVPRNAFDVCVDLLDKWKKDPNINEAVFEKCKKINNVDLDELRKGLKQCSPASYKQFEDLYNCVNIGLEFNPLINNEIGKIYAETASQLSKYNYNGIFIIFDEFSKFLEINSVNLSQDLKTIQDMAEQCSRSGKDGQLHLCCVTHKSISLYRPNSKQPSNADSFKTVEGRFKEIKFNRSVEENYQIIAATLIKKRKYEDIVNDALKENEVFLKNLNESNLIDMNVFKECYPINPLTLYFLIQISEHYAQNERTLFTFISDTDDNSFNSFIHSNGSGMFNIDKIYDYFSNVFRNEELNSARNIWYRSESILSKIEDPEERKIIKALAVILITNDYEKVPPNRHIISLSLCLDEDLTEKYINQLIGEGLIRRNLLNNLLSFSLSNTKQIDESFKIYYKSKFDIDKAGATLEAVAYSSYTLPRKYNEENKITRFYKNVYYTDKQFADIANFDYFFESNYCDGVIVHLLNISMSEKAIKEKVDSLNDKRVIVKYPKTKIKVDEFYQPVALYECLEDITRQKGIDDVAANEIELLKEECIEDIQTLLSNHFDKNFDFYSILKKDNMSYSDLLSETMSQCYSVCLLFNNELINKKVVTTQYQKAVNHVIDWLLISGKEEDFAYSPTSPEASIKIAVLDNNNTDDESSRNFKNIVDEITTAIKTSKGTRLSVVSLLDKYKYMPYGIRDGVLPIILAKAFSALPDDIVLYFANKEIDFCASNLIKTINNDKYEIRFSRSSKEQLKYLYEMMELFKANRSNLFRQDVSNLANAIRKYFIGLPQIVRCCTKLNNILKLPGMFLDYKAIFLLGNINPYESVFEKTKEVFEGVSYGSLSGNTKIIFDTPNLYLDNYKNDIVDKIKETFGFSKKESLRSGFANYFLKTLGPNTRPILNQTDKDIYDVLSQLPNYDDLGCVNVISRAITNLYIDDWDRDNKEKVIAALEHFKESIEKCDSIKADENILEQAMNTSVEISDVGNFLKNNLEEVLDEYSESIDVSEKIAVLTEILKKYL